jgi:predicted nucleic acid-binding Zn ribbon protein
MGRSMKLLSLGDILEAIFREKGYHAAIKEWEVVDSWERIVGGRIAEMTECDRVEDGILYVKVKAAPWRQELSYMKEKFKESIRNETGCSTITDIRFC